MDAHKIIKMKLDNKIKIRNLFTCYRVKQKGFTLIEILVVLAILGILASIILVAINSSRDKGKTAKVEADLRQLRTGIELLASDTGNWPNGCPPETSANPEVDLDDPQAGLVSIPTVGVVQAPCEWTASEVSYWNGPYVGQVDLSDPWGNPYVFDPDYQALSANAIVLVSFGPDGLNYTSDDIYQLIQQ